MRSRLEDARISSFFREVNMGSGNSKMNTIKVIARWLLLVRTQALPDWQYATAILCTLPRTPIPTQCKEEMGTWWGDGDWINSSSRCKHLNPPLKEIFYNRPVALQGGMHNEHRLRSLLSCLVRSDGIHNLVNPLESTSVIMLVQMTFNNLF